MMVLKVCPIQKGKLGTPKSLRSAAELGPQVTGSDLQPPEPSNSYCWSDSSPLSLGRAPKAPWAPPSCSLRAQELPCPSLQGALSHLRAWIGDVEAQLPFTEHLLCAGHGSHQDHNTDARSDVKGALSGGDDSVPRRTQEQAKAQGRAQGHSASTRRAK